MKIRCIYNSGEEIRPFEFDKQLDNNKLGRFGATSYTDFGLTIGEDYLVMGMIIGNGVLSYLINDGRAISCYPYALFDVIENNIPNSWCFRKLKNTDKNFPNQEVIWGYHELCFDEKHYEELIDFDEKAHQIYFKRKLEAENELNSLIG